MPVISTNGINLHYQECGSGEPLLLIMGITAPGGVWEKHAEAWSEKFRCILPDNRGVGLSDQPAGPYTSAMMAEEVAHAIPNAQLHLYEGAGHAFHWERIECFNPFVSQWLEAN